MAMVKAGSSLGMASKGLPKGQGGGRGGWTGWGASNRDEALLSRQEKFFVDSAQRQG